MIQQSHSYAYTQKKTIKWKDTCAPMFIAELFTIAKTWKESKYPWTDEQTYTYIRFILREWHMAHASQVALVVKNLPASAGGLCAVGSIPGSGRSPGGRHGNPLQYSCLENPKDRGARGATVHRVTNSWTRLKRFSMHTRLLLPRFRISMNLC